MCIILQTFVDIHYLLNYIRLKLPQLIQDLEIFQATMSIIEFNGAVKWEIYNTFYQNNYGNYNFKANSQCNCYIFYVNESIQFCMISGGTLPFKADFNQTLRND